jgi:long-chain acyl-CoA synthetase
MSDSGQLMLSGRAGTDSRASGGQTLPRLLLAQAKRYGDRPFVRMKRHGVWQSISWSRFAEQVLMLAQALRGRGVGAGDVLAVISENLPESYLIEYAAQCAGAAVTCLYPDASAEELQYIVEHCGARLIFAQDQEQVDKVLAMDADRSRVDGIVYLEDRGLWDYRDERLISLPQLMQSGADLPEAERTALRDGIASTPDSAIAALCYTSGTTGKPKGVVLTHRYLLDSAYRLVSSFEMPQHIDYLSYISPAWAAEQITGLGLSLLAPSVVHFSEKAETVQADLREIGPQFLLFTPRQWEMMASGVAGAMLDAKPWRRALVDWATSAGERGGWKAWLADRLALRAVRDNLGLKRAVIALSAGSGMSAEVFERFHALGVPLRNLYGSTEYGLVSAHWGGNFDPATLGRLLQVDASVGEPLQARVTASGELQLRGASGFGGYYRDEAATQAAMEDGWFRTGDAIRVHQGEQIVFMDRVKDLRQLSNGRAFPPQYIENQLRASPYIRDAIAIGDATRPFVTVLVNIDQGIVGRHAERIGLAWSTFADLSQMPQVHELIAGALRRINDMLEPHARVIRFAAFPKELDADDSELTRSRKLRREVIETRYAPVIDAMYEGRAGCPVEVLVKYQDGTQARIRQDVRITAVGE